MQPPLRTSARARLVVHHPSGSGRVSRRGARICRNPKCRRRLAACARLGIGRAAASRPHRLHWRCSDHRRPSLMANLRPSYDNEPRLSATGIRRCRPPPARPRSSHDRTAARHTPSYTKHTNTPSTLCTHAWASLNTTLGSLRARVASAPVEAQPFGSLAPRHRRARTRALGLRRPNPLMRRALSGSHDYRSPMQPHPE
jgi:hypothetical protein